MNFPETINLTNEGNNSLFTNCEEVAKELNNLFVNAVKNIIFPNYENYDSLAVKLIILLLKLLYECRNHPKL